MHVILTGATGLVGSAVLDALLRAKHVTQISILSRRPVAMADAAADPRVRVILHSDFAAYPPALLDQLRGAVGVVWALGISQNRVTRDEYVAITKDYALAAARAFAPLGGTTEGERFRFVYVSGEGATQDPGYLSATFARVKGETETALAALAADDARLRVDAVRPAFVDPQAHAAIRPYIPDPGLAMRAGMAVLGPPARRFYKRGHSPTEMLGDFFVKLATGQVDGALEGPGAFRLKGSWVVQNLGLRRVMGL